MGESLVTNEHYNHLERLITYLEDRLTDKYVKGQEEHGGALWEKDGLLDMAIDEAIDLCVYLITMKEQHENQLPSK